MLKSHKMATADDNLTGLQQSFHPNGKLLSGDDILEDGSRKIRLQRGRQS